MSSLRFQESTTIATAVSGIGSMMVDPYAPVRRMSIDTPPQQDSHAPAVLRGAALQIGGHAVAIALTAASTIVLTRFLGVDDYGRFTVLTVFLLIGVSLSEFGLNGTAIRWFAGGERPEEVFASLIGLRLVLSTLAAVVALVIFALYPHNDAPVTAAVITAAALILAGVNLTIPTALQARLDFRLAVGLDLTARAVSFATYAIAALVITADDPDRRLVAAVGGLAAGYLVSLVVGLAAVSRLSFPVVPTFHPATWRRLLRDALPLGIVMILGPRELPPRRARARRSQALVRRRHLRARLPLHGGGDPARDLRHRGGVPAARAGRGGRRAPCGAGRACRRSASRRVGGRSRRDGRARSRSRPAARRSRLRAVGGAVADPRALAPVHVPCGPHVLDADRARPAAPAHPDLRRQQSR